MAVIPPIHFFCSVLELLLNRIEAPGPNVDHLNGHLLPPDSMTAENPYSYFVRNDTTVSEMLSSLEIYGCRPRAVLIFQGKAVNL